MRLLTLVLWAGCSGDLAPDDDGADAQLVLRFEAGPAPDGIQLDALALEVDEVALEARGPDDDVSVSRPAGARFDVVGDAPPDHVAIALAPGRYEDAEATVHLRPRGDRPALLAAGWSQEQPFEVVVTMAVGLEGEIGELELAPREVRDLTLTLQPEAWLADIDEAEPTGDVLLVDATHNVHLYFELVEALVDSTDAEAEPR